MNRPTRWVVRVAVWLGVLGWWLLPTVDYAIDGDSQTSAWRFSKTVLYEGLWQVWNPPDYWEMSTGMKWDFTFYFLFFYVLLIGAVFLLVETLWRQGSSSGELRMRSRGSFNLVLGRSVVWASTALYWVWGVTGGYYVSTDLGYEQRDFARTLRSLMYKNFDYPGGTLGLGKVAGVSMFISVWSLLVMSVLLIIRPVYGEKVLKTAQMNTANNGGVLLVPPGIFGDDPMRSPDVDDIKPSIPPGILE